MVSVFLRNIINTNGAPNLVKFQIIIQTGSRLRTHFLIMLILIRLGFSYLQKHTNRQNFAHIWRLVHCHFQGIFPPVMSERGYFVQYGRTRTYSRYFVLFCPKTLSSYFFLCFGGKRTKAKASCPIKRQIISIWHCVSASADWIWRAGGHIGVGVLCMCESEACILCVPYSRLKTSYGVQGKTFLCRRIRP
jgi:hypothetical protein